MFIISVYLRADAQEINNFIQAFIRTVIILTNMLSRCNNSEVTGVVFTKSKIMPMWIYFMRLACQI